MISSTETQLHGYLLNEFGKDEPIITRDIKFEGCSRYCLYNAIRKLLKEGLLVRFCKGVYYLPTETMFGLSLLDSRKVVQRKYICSNSEVFGYYCGTALRHNVGLTTQVPNVLEIVTNNEKEDARESTIGTCRVITHSSKVKIDSQNVKVLEFLELMSTVSDINLDSQQKNKLCIYMKESGVSEAEILLYSSFFPPAAMKAFDAIGVP